METIYKALLSAAPKPLAINGLLIYLDLNGGAASIAQARTQHQEVCYSGGSPDLVKALIDLVGELGLVSIDGDQLVLTDMGTKYAQGGGAQGQSRWEMTPTRRAILVGQWYKNPSEGFFQYMEEHLNGLLDAPVPADSGKAVARFLEGIGLCSVSNGKVQLTMAGAKLIRDLAIMAVKKTPDVPASDSPKPSPIHAHHALPVPSESALLEDVATRLNDSGFKLTYEQLANLYLCAKSSYLTVLAGPPGSGKSSLVRRLASALGHRSTLLEVPVRRGWTDDYAFIGAVNRLHDRFDPAPTRVVEHLLAANADSEALYWVLLDEFNLSTPEYYFAEFISALESDQPSLKLYHAGDSVTNADKYPASIPLGSGLHLFGTVNLDDTSQSLSPRLIDRANVVWIERPMGLDILNVSELAPSTVGSVNAAQIASWRGPAAIVGEERAVFEAVLNLLGTTEEFGTPHLVSPRAILAVAGYLGNSKGVLSPRTALDFATAQRVLPGLRGYGEPFGKRLQALQELLAKHQLQLSASLLARVLKTGQDRGHEYDFIVGLL